MKIQRFNLLYRIIISLGFVVLHVLYRLRVEGRENIPTQGPCILLPKHQFWTDIPIVGLAAGKPLYFIAKQELFRYPGVTQFMRLLGAIPLDRIKPIKSLKTFRSVNHLLKNSEFIVLFPEGTYYPYSLGQGKYRFIENILRFQENQKWFGEKAISFLPMGIAYEKKGLRPKVKVKIGAPFFSNGKVDGPEFTRRLIDEIGKLSELT